MNVLKGYRIPFIRKPPLIRLCKLNCEKFKPKVLEILSDHITDLLNIKAISPNKFATGYLSPIFLREKSNGSHRLIFNLKSLNFYVHPPKFRLISLKKVSQIIQRGDYLVKIDISNAYYHLPVWDSHRRFLSFYFQGQIYNMNCLPFGLSSAPSIFSKLTNWVATLLRENGIRTIVYLDDFLLMNQDPTELTRQADWTVKFLQELGWHVNVEKCVLAPKTRIEYLGLMWDTRLNKISLPHAKILNIRKSISQTLRKNKWCWYEAKQLLGKLSFAANAVSLGLLHCRIIQMSAKYLPVNQKYKMFLLQNQVKVELHWWLKNVSQPSMLQGSPPSAFIATDASDVGWGAIVNGKKLSGRWNNSQKQWHCNQKELWTVFIVLQMQREQLQRKTIIIQTDNRTAASYIRKQGGTKSRILFIMASKILKFAQENQMTLIPKYLPGRYNGLADSLSRHKSHQEWHLDHRIRTIIFQRLGTPEIDLFATKISAVVPRYVSEDHRDKLSEFTDAFSRPWSYKLAWIFPPPALIPRTLQHLNISHGHYILIAPRWEKAFWRAEVKKRAVRPPFRIKNLRAHLLDLRTNLPPRDIRNLSLEAWKIRAGVMR